MTTSQELQLRELLAKAMGKIERLSKEVETLNEPIAVVGMACRLPGHSNTPEAYWDLLLRGGDAVVDTASRWQNMGQGQPASAVTRAGLIDNVDHFDPTFFNISPREAEKLDPQQRLLLEVSYEALERAGYPLSHLNGGSAGVFIASTWHDYERILLQTGNLQDAHALTGSHNAFNAGRLSYYLGVHGPAMSVDTACSSGLVAIHLAAQSLRLGECGMAVVGAVNLMLSPLTTDLMFSANALSPDGRCSTFDAGANGYVRGEGCVVVVLKRLRDALAHHDTVLAVVRGSAVNQDGQSAGLTSPNGKAQEALLRTALGHAHLTADRVGYVEAHGTGTPVGDPIEMSALRAVYGDGTGNCVVSSVKPNIGHLEGAAGLAGFVKAVLVLQNRTIVPSINFQTLNPLIDLEGSRLRVAVRPEAWESTVPRIAGVSSFGLSGTNAHVLIEEAPASATATAAPPWRDGPHVLVLSARSVAALSALSDAYQRALPTLQEHPHAVAAAAMHRRTHHEVRRVVVGSSPQDWAAALKTGTIATAPMGGKPRRIVFTFPGQGSQWLGMGRELLRDEPAFLDAMQQCDTALKPFTGWSAVAVLRNETTVDLERVDTVQPLLFAMQVSLASLWRAYGVHPDAVVGHSMGEVAAAVIAGALSLSDGARVVCTRSQLVRAAGAGRGAMMVVEADVDEAQRCIEPFGGRVCIAAYNAPRSQVLSGDAEALTELQRTFTEAGVFCRMVRVDFASHSPHVDTLLDSLEHALAPLQPQAPKIRFYSTVNGEPLSDATMDARYWCRNLRQPVLFTQTMARLLEDGHDTFVEISPHPILPAAEGALCTGTLRRNEPERSTFLQAWGTLLAHGCRMDTTKLYAASTPMVALPTYPWQRERSWVSPLRKRTAIQSTRGFLGEALTVGAHADETHWHCELDLDKLPFLKDHRIGDVVVVPGAAYVEMMLAASQANLCDIRFVAPVTLSSDAPTTLQITRCGNALTVRVSNNDGTWRVCATARMDTSSPAATGYNAPAARPAAFTEKAALYQAFASADLHYGPAFQGLMWLASHEGAMWGKLDIASAPSTFRLHPAILDAAFHGAGPGEGKAPCVPIAIDQVQMLGDPTLAAWTRVQARSSDEPAVRRMDVDLLDAAGRVVVRVANLAVRALDSSRMRRQEDVYIAPRWEPATELPAGTAAGTWLVLSDALPATVALEAALRRAGGEVVSVPFSPDWRRQLDQVLQRPEPFRAIVHAWSTLCRDDAPEGAQAILCDPVVALLQKLTGCAWRDMPQLFLMTQNATQVDAGDAVIRPIQALAWGLGRTIAYESPLLRCRRLDVDAAVNSEHLVAELCATSQEDEVALRGAQRFVCRLQRRPDLRDGATETLPLRPNATYLITGGLGGLGFAVAQWCVARGARHIALMGRNVQLSDAQRDVVAQLQAQQVNVALLQADVSVASDVQRVLAQIRASMPPLRGVLHCAGVLADGLLTEQTAERFSRVLGPKVLGAWHLHEQTAQDDLDLFVLYSSAASLLGSPGQGNYAAANAYMDALAHARRAAGKPALSINWGTVDEVGLAAAQANRGARLAHRGMRGLTVDMVHASLERLIVRGAVQCGVAHLAARQWLASYPHLASSKRFASLVAHDESSSTEPTSVLGTLQNLPAGARLRALEEFVCEQLAVILRVDAAQINGNSAFRNLGVDSLMALELRNRLEVGLGVRLSASLLWAHPTVRALCTHLLGTLRFGVEMQGTVDVQEPATEPAMPRDALAALQAELARGVR